MPMPNVPRSVHATLNFSSKTERSGQWSNVYDDRIDMKVDSRAVEVIDARSLERGTTLQHEGVILTHSPLGNYDWFNSDWIEDIYIPSCVDLVRALTGKLAYSYYGAYFRIADPVVRSHLNASQPARFVHIDQTRKTLQKSAAEFAARENIGEYSRAIVYNVWRTISPPPQDAPLAVCDQRTVNPDHFAEGAVADADDPSHVAPYTGSAYSADQRWYYFPNMNSDEALVFKGVDTAIAEPLGCLHSAFDLPFPGQNAAPRSSVECRIIAFDQP